MLDLYVYSRFVLDEKADINACCIISEYKVKTQTRIFQISRRPEAGLRPGSNKKNQLKISCLLIDLLSKTYSF